MVNGIELAIGQQWCMRGGEAVVIKYFVADDDLCWELSNGHRVNEAGQFWKNGRPCEYDLIMHLPTTDGPVASAEPVKNQPLFRDGSGYPFIRHKFVPCPAPEDETLDVARRLAPASRLDGPAKVVNPKDAIGNIKLPLHLWPAEASALGSLGMLEGECKYGRNNYIAGDGVIASIYVDAAKRHLDAWFAGEECAPDTGTPHLANALASIAIVVKARAHGRLIDDRDFAPNPGYRKLVDEITPHVARIKAMFADKSPRHFTIEDVKAAA